MTHFPFFLSIPRSFSMIPKAISSTQTLENYTEKRNYYEFRIDARHRVHANHRRAMFGRDFIV